MFITNRLPSCCSRLFQAKSLFSTASILAKEESSNGTKSRRNSWNLPDLEKLPGGFRGKVYNKRDWKEYLAKNTKILEQEAQKEVPIKVTPPPEGWRQDKSLPQYMKNKYALKEKAMKINLRKTKKLSRSAIDGIRVLHAKYPNELTTEKLAEFFKISQVAIAKVLKSKWQPTPEELAKKQAKWEKRGKYLIHKQSIDMKLKEFFEEKEKQLGLELPYFLKQELTDFYKLNGFKGLEENFNVLNEARIEKQKDKTDDLTTLFQQVANN